MFKWVINKLYKYCPTCPCGYKMKPSNFRKDEYSWRCIFFKSCGTETYQTTNGTLHWFKKSEKK
jgi:hypothetical protein